MSKAEPKQSIRLSELLVYIAVTVPLLLIGAMLWSLRLVARTIGLMRKQEENNRHE